MFRFTTSSSSASTSTGARRLLGRVAMLARAEAQAAQERRGLPFSGLFTPTDVSTRPADAAAQA